jgi:hypothetical protein
MLPSCCKDTHTTHNRTQEFREGKAMLGICERVGHTPRLLKHVWRRSALGGNEGRKVMLWPLPHRDCWDVVGVGLLGVDDKGDGWLDGDGDVVGTRQQHILDGDVPLSVQDSKATTDRSAAVRKGV